MREVDTQPRLRRRSDCDAETCVIVWPHAEQATTERLKPPKSSICVPGHITVIETTKTRWKYEAGKISLKAKAAAGMTVVEHAENASTYNARA